MLARNAFIVGVQKAGTTALHAFLSRHPDIHMSQPKELHFFDNDAFDWSAPDYSILERHFGGHDASVRGEATPIYLYWPNCLERLRAYDPSARLIVILRHPTFRAFSHWKMETARSREHRSFEDAVGVIGRARAGQLHRIYSYVQRGYYAPQITRLLSLFPRRQIYITTTDTLWLDPQSVLEDLEDFLEIPHRLKVDPEYIILATSDIPVELEPVTRSDLDAQYFDDIRSTQELTGLDLSSWLSPAYAELEKS